VDATWSESVVSDVKRHPSSQLTVAGGVDSLRGVVDWDQLDIVRTDNGSSDLVAMTTGEPLEMLPEDDTDGGEISPRCDTDGDTARFTL
jgi:hypothetical protein